VPLSAAEITLPKELSLAAINNPAMCVVSGPADAIAAYEESLDKQSVACRRLFTSHAFHSAMMEPILAAFEQRLRGIAFHAPRIPYLSNVTGTWIKAEEATDPAYWARHIRSTVRFSDNLAELFSAPERVLIESGPGNALTTLARQQGGPSAKAFASLPHPRENVSALRCAFETLGRLWTLGVNVDWSKHHAASSVQRVSLPTYPFERQKFWIEPDTIAKDAQPAPVLKTPSANAVSADEAVSLYRRVWTRTPLLATATAEPGPWLLFRDTFGIADEIARYLKAAKQNFSFVELAAASNNLGTVATRYVPLRARITMRSLPLCSSLAEFRAKSFTSGLSRRKRTRRRSKKLSTAASSVLSIWRRRSRRRIFRACSWRSSPTTCSRWQRSLCAILLAPCFSSRARNSQGASGIQLQSHRSRL